MALSNVDPANIGPLKGWWRQFAQMTTLTCSLASEGDVCLPTCCVTWCFSLPWGCSSRQAFIWWMEMLAEASLLLLLLRKDVEAPAFSQYKGLRALFTNHGTKLLGRPWRPTAWAASFPFCIPAALECFACPQHTAAATPNLSVLWFSNHLQFRPDKGRTVWPHLFGFPAEEMRSCLYLSLHNWPCLLPDVHFNRGSFQIWGQSQAIVKTSRIFEQKTMEIMNRK